MPRLRSSSWIGSASPRRTLSRESTSCDDNREPPKRNTSPWRGTDAVAADRASTTCSARTTISLKSTQRTYTPRPAQRTHRRVWVHTPCQRVARVRARQGSAHADPGVHAPRIRHTVAHVGWILHRRADQAAHVVRDVVCMVPALARGPWHRYPGHFTGLDGGKAHTAPRSTACTRIGRAVEAVGALWFA